MKDDVFKYRRRIAITSFITVIALVPTLLGIAMFGDVEQAPMMQAVMPILVILIPALIANISHYMHLVHALDKDNEQSE
jgi:hypothetical protein